MNCLYAVCFDVWLTIDQPIFHDDCMDWWLFKNDCNIYFKNLAKWGRED